MNTPLIKRGTARRLGIHQPPPRLRGIINLSGITVSEEAVEEFKARMLAASWQVGPLLPYYPTVGAERPLRRWWRWGRS